MIAVPDANTVVATAADREPNSGERSRTASKRWLVEGWRHPTISSLTGSVWAEHGERTHAVDLEIPAA